MKGSKSRRAAARLFSIILAFTFAAAAHPLPVHAVPADLADKRAQAERIAEQVRELDEQVEIVIERYNQAGEALDRTEGAVSQTRVDLDRAKSRLKARQTALSKRVRGIYRNGDVTFVQFMLSSSSFVDFVQQLDMLVRIGVHDAKIVSDIKVTKRAIQKRQADLAVQLKERKAVAAQVASDKSHIEGRLAEREKMLSTVKDEIAEMKRREAVEQARLAREADARIASGDFGSGGGDVRPPDTNDVKELLAVARAQLGDPYQYGASGPDAFDCSGFTMYCYSQIGISLSHHSGSQISEGPRVDRAHLMAGDLVFFGSPIHHVGLYVGGGQFIHAPHSGDVVSYRSLDSRSDFAGACRPLAR
jgi:cell wall-associated NlpC family hydrolase